MTDFPLLPNFILLFCGYKLYCLFPPIEETEILQRKNSYPSLALPENVLY